MVTSVLHAPFGVPIADYAIFDGKYRAACSAILPLKMMDNATEPTELKVKRVHWAPLVSIVLLTHYSLN